jgi:hypothetical protein
VKGLGLWFVESPFFSSIISFWCGWQRWTTYYVPRYYESIFEILGEREFGIKPWCGGCLHAE